MNVATNLQAAPAVVTGLPNTAPDPQGASLDSAAGTSAAGISMVESRSADITLNTTQGDRVTLSFSTEAEVSYQVYTAEGVLGGAPPARLETFTLSSGSEMTIVVDGELSDAEKADIETVMSAVEEMAEEFFEGDVDSALAELMEMGETTSIAGLQVSLETSRSFAVSYGDAAAPALQEAGAGTPEAIASSTEAGAPAGTQTATGQATQAPQPTPPATPASSSSSGASGASTAPAAPEQNAQAAATAGAGATDAAGPGAQSNRITVDSLRSFVSSMTGTVGGAGIELSKAGRHMLKIFDRLLDKIAGDMGFGEDKHKLADVVKAELAGQIEEMAGHEAHEAHDGREGGFAREMKDAQDAHGNEDRNGHGHKHGHGHGRG